MSTMSTLPPEPIAEPTGVLLRGVAWQTYEQLRDEPANHGLRLTYAGGALEVMTPSHRHEHWHKMLGRAIEAMTEELLIPIKSGAATTLRCNRREVGLDPDECYWVQHDLQVRNKLDIDLAVDPPPDLCIECEASRRAIDKLPLFRSLGVPEVWRYDGERLIVHVLRHNEEFAVEQRSNCFPWLPLAEFTAQIGISRATDETTWIRGFRDWVRKLAPNLG